MPFVKQVPARRREQETADEIDSILEEQAVLTNYKQRSGQ